ncbi:MAG: hypothetical protein JWP89_5307 [Schlesneria sp.]|nr:hypothetical protein [Schlesneria sp.]
MKSTRLILMGAIVAVLGATMTQAQKPPRNDLNELVPAQLDNWKVEYHLFFPRENIVRVTLDSTGKLCRHATGRNPQDFFKQMSQVDTSAIFSITRELLNSYKVRPLPMAEEDGFWILELCDERSHKIKIRLCFGEAASLGVADQLNRATSVFEKYGVQGIERSRILHPAKKQADRLPTNATDWEVMISDLVISPKKTTVWHDRSKVELVRTATDAQAQQDIFRKILDQYQLRNIAPDRDKPVGKTFDIHFDGGCSLLVTCDREMLAEVGLLDELDRYAADINERLKKQKAEFEFIPPWREMKSTSDDQQ